MIRPKRPLGTLGASSSDGGGSFPKIVFTAKQNHVFEIKIFEQLVKSKEKLTGRV